jgi:hypothetical protein
MKRSFCGQAGVLLAVVMFATVGTLSSARADWHVETVDSAGNVGYYPSLAIDADGNPHVTYFEQTSGELRYAKRIGGAWQIEVVPTDYPSSFGGQSMALDSQGRPHIVHFADTPGLGGYVTYTHWTGTEWQSSYVVYSNARSSIALTTADEPRIAFMGHSDNGDALWYAYPTGASWSVEHVCGSGYGCCGGQPALALDSNDNPRIGWGYAGYFVYAWPGPEYPWPAEWLGSNVDYRSVSMGLDSADEACVAYCDSGYNLYYGHRAGGVWSFETVVSAGAFEWSSCLALDPSDQPHIAYVSTSSGAPLKYAHRMPSSSWCIQTVDPAPNTGYPISLAIDPAGKPHICYVEGTNYDLKYARWDPSVFTGDLNCDGCVGFGDINPFVLYLSNNALWQTTYSGCNPLNGDINGDGTYGQASFGDINPFVALLTR